MATYRATVSRVIDGDTFETAAGTVIRLARVNAPEAGTSGASIATRYLRNLIEGRLVIITSVATDNYGRTVANVRRAADGLDVNQYMISLGYG